MYFAFQRWWHLSRLPSIHNNPDTWSVKKKQGNNQTTSNHSTYKAGHIRRTKTPIDSEQFWAPGCQEHGIWSGHQPLQVARLGAGLDLALLFGQRNHWPIEHVFVKRISSVVKLVADLFIG